MLKTPVCGVLGIDVPIVQGPLGGPWRQGTALAAAVSEAGGLGSVPTSLRTAVQVRQDVAEMRELTGRSITISAEDGNSVLMRTPKRSEGMDRAC